MAATSITAVLRRQFLLLLLSRTAHAKCILLLACTHAPYTEDSFQIQRIRSFYRKKMHMTYVPAVCITCTDISPCKQSKHLRLPVPLIDRRLLPFARPFDEPLAFLAADPPVGEWLIYVLPLCVSPADRTRFQFPGFTFAHGRLLSDTMEGRPLWQFSYSRTGQSLLLPVVASPLPISLRAYRIRTTSPPRNFSALPRRIGGIRFFY